MLFFCFYQVNFDPVKSYFERKILYSSLSSEIKNMYIEFDIKTFFNTKYDLLSQTSHY